MHSAEKARDTTLDEKCDGLCSDSAL